MKRDCKTGKDERREGRSCKKQKALLWARLTAVTRKPPNAHALTVAPMPTLPILRQWLYSVDANKQRCQGQQSTREASRDIKSKLCPKTIVGSVTFAISGGPSGALQPNVVGNLIGYQTISGYQARLFTSEHECTKHSSHFPHQVVNTNHPAISGTAPHCCSSSRSQSRRKCT